MTGVHPSRNIDRDAARVWSADTTTRIDTGSRDAGLQDQSQRTALKLESVWSVGSALIEALLPVYRLPFQAAIRAQELQQDWYVLWLARGLQPEHLTPHHLARLLPYTAPEACLARLASLEAKGLLEAGQTTAHTYRLTHAGHQATERIRRMAQRELGKAEMLSKAESRHLADLLHRITQAITQSPAPQDKLAFQCSRWTDLGVVAPPLTRIDHYLTELTRFREDCHFVAWQPYGVEGIAWETLTMLWRQPMCTPAKMAKKLSYRGYSSEAYHAALQTLVNLRWASDAGTKDSYRLTALGQQVRLDAEKMTDSLFFAPWSALPEGAVDDLETLFQKLLKALNQSG